MREAFDDGGVEIVEDRFGSEGCGIADQLDGYL